MTPGILSLSRSEVGHLADVLEVLVALHGGGQRRAADELHLRHVQVGEILARRGALRVLPALVQGIAAAAASYSETPVTVERLLSGQVVLALPTPLWELAGRERGWVSPTARSR